MNKKNGFLRGNASRKAALLIGTAAAAALFAGTASAQEKAQAESAKRESDTQLENIVVTAQRTQQQLQDVPMSVTAITQQQLQIQGVQSGQNLNITIPNLVVGDNSSNGINSSITIRGIPSVGLYVDGIWTPDIGFRQGGLVEQQRVEVLYGPQGTLFGRNTNGGAINYITVPPAKEFHINGSAELGDYQRRFVDLSVDIPLTDTLFTKWTAAIHDRGGYVKSLANGEMYGGNNTKVFRGDVLWKPSEKFTLRATVNDTKLVFNSAYAEIFLDHPDKNVNISNIAAYNIAMLNPAYGPYTLPAGGATWLPRFAGEGGQWTAQNNSWNWPGGRVGKWENEETQQLQSDRVSQTMYTATATWQATPHIKFTNLASYLRQESYHDDDSPAAPIQLWEQLRDWRYDYWQEELHVEGDLFHNKVNFLGGFYYQHSRERDRTYSWAYSEFQLPSDPSNPFLSNGNVTVADATLINFIHAWGVANANTPLGKTIDLATGKTLAQDLQTWKIPKKDAGYQAAANNLSDPNTTLSDNINNDYSVFGNVTWHALEGLDLQGGLRAAWNRGTNNTEAPTGAFRSYLMPQRGGGIGYGPGTPWEGGTVVLSQNPYPGGLIVTPMATVTYHWTPDLMTYVRYAQGYTTGSSSFNATLNQTQVLPPEQVHSFEGGLKADWLNHRLRTNLTVFHMIWDGQRIAASLPITSGPNAGTFGVFTIGGGKSRAQGAELEVDASPIRGLKLSSSLGYLDTRWVVFDATNGFRAGTMWGLAPRWSYHVAAQYDFELPNQADITLRTDYGHQSKYYTSGAPSNQVLPPFPGYGILNARIKYSPKGGQWNVQVFGENLGDVAAITSGSGSFTGGNVTNVALNPRRRWGVRLGFYF